MSAASLPADDMSAAERGLNVRQAAFAREYIVDLNATQAAIRAGYKGDPDTVGPRLLCHVGVRKLIDELIAKRSERVEFRAEDVLREWVTIATANPGELVRYRVRACRYCHGNDHDYQWINYREWEKAAEVALEQKPRPGEEPAPIPSNVGGYGYSTDLKPVPGCFRCLGNGITDVLVPDTTQLTPAAAKLYAGVKQTKDGFEVKMRDQDGALEKIARHLGMLKKQLDVKVDRKRPDELTDEELLAIIAEGEARNAGGANKP